MKKIYLILIFALLFSSCEDVIDIDLKNVEPQIVIEAKMFDKATPATVVLTKTTNFFGEPEIETLSGAKVTISDSDGSVVDLSETQPGVYSAMFFGEPGKTYNLSVEAENKIYTASAYMPQPLIIDSLTSIYNFYNFPEETEGMQVKAYFKNVAGIRDFARLELYRNNERSLSFYLFDDTYVDGNTFEYFFFDQTFEQGDTIAVQMLTCDRGVYDYLLTLSNIAGETFHDTGTPYNPASNISNGALGYFGVFSTDVKMIVIR